MQKHDKLRMQASCLARTKLCTFHEQTQLRQPLLAIDDACLAHARIDEEIVPKTAFPEIIRVKDHASQVLTRAIFAL